VIAKDFIQKVNDLIQNDLPFVLFSLPDSDKVTLYYQENKELYTAKNLNFEGFVLAPFLWNKTLDYIPNTLSLTLAKAELKTSHSKTISVSTTETKTAHIRLVNRAILDIESGNTSKIVCSRKEQIAVKIAVLDTFITMLNKYPFAFNYVFQHPKLGKWMGASPELLLSYKTGVLKTVALAGTQAFDHKKTHYVWRKKEQDEQQIVTDFIVAQLEQVSSSISVSEAETSAAGNVVHLKSKITSQTAVDKVFKALELLHPTPAVCGFPRKNALEFILKNEGYKRSYYTGFFGLVNQKFIQFFVNLRCLEMAEDLAIYVGGGINGASIAEEEWQETVLKATVMQSILKV